MIDEVDRSARIFLSCCMRSSFFSETCIFWSVGTGFIAFKGAPCRTPKGVPVRNWFAIDRMSLRGIKRNRLKGQTEPNLQFFFSDFS